MISVVLRSIIFHSKNKEKIGQTENIHFLKMVQKCRCPFLIEDIEAKFWIRDIFRDGPTCETQKKARVLRGAPWGQLLVHLLIEQEENMERCMNLRTSRQLLTQSSIKELFLLCSLIISKKDNFNNTVKKIMAVKYQRP